jgi:hypothetical protein
MLRHLEKFHLPSGIPVYCLDLVVMGWFLDWFYKRTHVLRRTKQESRAFNMSVRQPRLDSHSGLLCRDPTLRVAWVSPSVGRCRLAVPVWHPTTTRYGNGTYPSPTARRKAHTKLCGGVKISFAGKVTALHSYSAELVTQYRQDSNSRLSTAAHVIQGAGLVPLACFIANYMSHLIPQGYLPSPPNDKARSDYRRFRCSLLDK